MFRHVPVLFGVGMIWTERLAHVWMMGIHSPVECWLLGREELEELHSAYGPEAFKTERKSSQQQNIWNSTGSKYKPNKGKQWRSIKLTDIITWSYSRSKATVKTNLLIIFCLKATIYASCTEKAISKNRLRWWYETKNGDIYTSNSCNTEKYQ